MEFLETTGKGKQKCLKCWLKFAILHNTIYNIKHNNNYNNDCKHSRSF